MDITELELIIGERLGRISHSRKQNPGIGNISSAPQDILEISLAVVSLLEAGCPRKLFVGKDNDLVSTLSEWLDQYTRPLEIASHAKPDVDITAAVITALNLLGRSTLADRLITSFAELDHIETDNNVGNDEDFTTKCQVLIALLQVDNGVNLYRAQIQQTVTSVCSIWWAKSHKHVKNRRNISPLYSIMLLSKALTTYAVVLSSVSHTDECLLDNKISLMLTEVLATLLRDQNEDGSWGERSDFEETSYAVLAMKFITAFPFAYNFEAEIHSALLRSYDIFRRRDNEYLEPKNLWIGKVPYSSNLLSQAYFLGALRQSAWLHPPNMHRFGQSGLSRSSEKLFTLARALPILRDAETWQVKSCLLQGDFFSSIVKASIPRIFPRENMRKETYLDLVPFTWAASRQLESLKLRNQELLDMMVLAVTIYQIDEFMEATVIRLDDSDMRKLDDSIEGLSSEHLAMQASENMASHEEAFDGKQTSGKALSAIIDAVKQYIYFVLQHPLVSNARPLLQRQLRSDIKRFLKAHLRQVKDNKLLRDNKMATVESVHGSVFSWLRNTSADHTGGPFAMTYYLCLIEDRSDNPQSISTEGLYVAQMVSQHLAALCRTYNDWGSRVRDAAEFNVNSLNFEEILAEPKTLNRIIGNGASLDQQSCTGPVAGHAEPEKRLLFIAVRRTLTHNRARAITTRTSAYEVRPLVYNSYL
ncbi:hypothetical protein F5Y12DRAFT_793764 [Xylaria sp. FL1777]|nr:hypothetical protein F5Y12DRAFT_793764 [Xylaria sp. FL1777]